MKIQLAYKYTGEDPTKLVEYLKKIVKILEKNKNKVYCPILDPNHSEEKKEVFINALDKIKEADALLAIIKSDDKSEGMLMEIGCALSLRKKLILAIQKGIKSNHLRSLAAQIIEFSDLEDLYKKLEYLK